MPWFWGRGWCWRWRWWWFGYPYSYYWEIFPELEKTWLKDEARFLKAQLSAIEKRLAELKKSAEEQK